MSYLSQLKNVSGAHDKRRKRVGRGPSSGHGKTSCRGHRGASARSGYRQRYGYEGGQTRLFTRLPTRGFTRGKFIVPVIALNLIDIEKNYDNGEVVNLKTLFEKGIVSRSFNGRIKILSRGELKKNVRIEAHYFSKQTKEKLDANKVDYKVLGVK
jgi:large subunit ribosomal protein L15